MEEKKENTAATAGRGFLVITAAKLWFMAGGALVAFALPKYLGKEGYGQYIDISNTLSIFSMVMITGGLQSVSKFVSETPDKAGGVVRQSLIAMSLLGLVFGGAFIFGAPWIAEFRGNQDLSWAYRAAGIVLIAYAIYTVFIGTLNGRKNFLSQAKFDMGFTTLKTGLMLGFAVAGLGATGAIGGFALAALLIMAAAAFKVWPTLGSGESNKKLYAFGAQVMLYTLVFNLIFKLDVLMLKPVAQTLLGTDTQADALIGVYGLALQISRLPWQATLAITFVIFPMVSEATFHNDRERTRLYIQQTLRYSLLLVGAPAVVLMALPQSVVGFFGTDFAQATIALRWLAPAYFVFALFNIVNTLLMSAGRATEALIIGIISVGSAAAMYHFALPLANTAEALLALAGQTTGFAFAIGLLLGIVILARRYGSPIPGATFVRVVGIGAAFVFAAQYMPQMNKLITLAAAVALGILFFVALFVTREFTAEDKARFMKVIHRKKA